MGLSKTTNIFTGIPQSTIDTLLSPYLKGSPSSVANLRTIDTTGYTAQNQVSLQGALTLGDGGGGIFVYSPTSTAADDGGTVVRPAGIGSGSPGRWLRQFAGAVNAAWFGLAGDGVTDDRPAILAALSAGQEVMIPAARGGASYYLGNNIVVPAGTKLYTRDLGTTLLFATGITSANPLIRLGTGCTLEGFAVDAGSVRAGIVSVFGNGAANLVVRDVQLRNVGTTGISLNNCSYCCVHNVVSSGLGSPHIVLTAGCHHNYFSNISITGQGRLAGGSYGILLTRFAGCHNNCFVGCDIAQTTLEGIGIAKGNYLNSISSLKVDQAGDNGLSIVGDRNTVSGAVLTSNWFHGVTLWGEGNTLDGIVAINNGQFNVGRTAPTNYSGISITPGFGGLGAKNSIGSHCCIDNQSTATQQWGVLLDVSSYTVWAQGLAATVGLFVVSGLNIYVATTAGNCGANQPVHTSGTVSDGAVSWTWVNSLNTLVGGSAPLTLWSAGTAVTFGQRLRASTGIVYQYTNVASQTTGGTEPAFKFGSGADGTATASVVEEIPTLFHAWDNSMGPGSYQGNALGSVGYLSGNTNTVYDRDGWKSSAPARNVGSTFRVNVTNVGGAADPGSMYFYHGAGAGANNPGLAAWVKEFGTGASGWFPAANVLSGTTANRPPLAAEGSAAAGYWYFDTTLGKPIVWSGSGWVDCTGAGV